MNLWNEVFNPVKIEIFEPLPAEFEKAWNWIFERGENGFVRAEMALSIIRNHSKDIHKRGAGLKSSKIASVGIWKRYCASNLIPVRKTISRPVYGAIKIPLRA